MAHHFDIQAAKDDPRLNICDFYVFSGSPGRTTMVMTTCPDVGLSSVDVLHPEGLYAFRFDLDEDEKEDIVFTFRFGEPRHADAGAHVQDFDVIVASGARSGTRGRVLASGRTGKVSQARNVSAFVGVVPELWAADGAAFQTALHTLAAEGRFDEAAFTRRENLFRNRNIVAAVLEVPDSMLGAMPTRAWATISLFGHAPEIQVYRFGFPLFTHLFLSGPEAAGMAERYHAATPAEDRRMFAPAVAAFVERLSGAAGFVHDPRTYGWQVANRLCPSMIPYQVGAPPAFETDVMNGRTLGADAYDTMWSLAAGRSVADGVAPPVARLIRQFPYYGKPFESREQKGLVPLKALIGYAPDARGQKASS